LKKNFIITIDGPAAAGKTTVSRLAADELNFDYVDTGALYRALAYFILSLNISPEDENGVVQNLDKAEIDLKNNKVLLNNVDISGEIRTPEVSMAASKVSSYKAVRDFLLGLQKKIGSEKNAVFEGRDMGTSVFPHADLKFYLTADLKERAKRRFLQAGKKSEQTFEQVMEDMEKRDYADMNREHSPLKPAEDAFKIDSTDISAEDVKDIILEKAKKNIK
jgi:cytidylate kinase